MDQQQLRDERFKSLRNRLQCLRYHQPLGIETAPLCEALLHDLEQSNSLLTACQDKVETHARELIDAQKRIHPLRQENGRLLRENNQLHLALIEDRETAKAKHKQTAAMMNKLQGKLSESMFVSSQLRQRVRTLEADNQALRDRLEETLRYNGLVLPSGVEVRLHASQQACSPTACRANGRCVFSGARSTWSR